MTRVLFTIHTSTVFAEPFRLAKLLQQEGIEPVFVFAYKHWTADVYARHCTESGVSVYQISIDDRFCTRLLGATAARLAVVHRRRQSIISGFLWEYVSLLHSLATARA